MIRTVRAIEFSRPMKVGSKNPALFLCGGINGEQEEVVVKFREVLLRQQFSCVGECVAAFLAMDLGLSCAEPVIVELDGGLATAVHASDWPDFSDRIRRSEGLNFGSVFLGPGFESRLPSEKDGPQLKRFWADLYCFDFLIQNYDRVAENPNYLRRGDRVTVIDHEQAFRNLDTGVDVNFSVEDLMLDPFYRHVAFLTLDLATEFRPFFERFSQLSKEQIAGYFTDLPVAWRDHRSILLERYLHWAQIHANVLCERLTSLLAT